jgi:hypothetical protein
VEAVARIARGDAAGLRLSDFKRLTVRAWLLVSILPVLLVVTIATFPGERVEENLPPVRFIPTTWAAWQLPTLQAIQTAGSGWATLHELLVAGQVIYVTGRPQSLLSNVLVLPNFEVGDRVKLDAEGKIAISSDALSLRGRSLEGAVLAFAHLRKADFTGAQLVGAIFSNADLREAKFECGMIGGSDPAFGPPGESKDKICAQLRGARFSLAQLQGASLIGAQLQGGMFVEAQLQGANLDQAQLQGAVLTQAGFAELDARLDGASLRQNKVWRTYPPSNTNGALVAAPDPDPKYFQYNCTAGKCEWSEASWTALRSLIENSVPVPKRNQALRQIAALEKPPDVADEASAEAWTNLAKESAH